MAETLRKIQQQTNNLFGGMEFHQKVTFAVLALMVMIPFGFLIFGSQSGGEVPLQWGAAFDTEVLRQAEQALVERGFNDFRTVGQRIMAPASKVEEYNGALSAAGIWSPHAASELEAALKDVSVFTPKNQFDAKMDVHLRKEIRSILRTIDGIQDVQVMWSRPEGGSRWRNQSPVKASVHVTPRGNRALSPALVESLRAAVASMVPDLTREHVVILDRSSGQSWTGGDPDDPFNNKLEELKRSRVQFRQNQIRSALEQMIPHVIVAVNVEFDDVLSTRERSQVIEKGAVELTNIQETSDSTSSDGPAGSTPGTQANTPRNLASNDRQQTTSDSETKTQSYSAPSMKVSETERAPFTEKSLQVAVSIPEDHLETLVIRDGILRGTSDQEKAEFTKALDTKRMTVTDKVKSIVARLIPPDSAADAIEVTTHQRIEREMPPADLPIMDMIKDFIRVWGSSIALFVFGLWALMMLKKSMPVSESAPGTDAIDKLAEAVRPPEPVEADEEAKPMTNRDFLQMSVQDDPAAAAAILSKWLQKA